MFKRKLWAALAGLTLLSLLIAACAPQVQTVEVTSVVKETVVVSEIQTQVAVQTVVVQADTPEPEMSFSTPHPLLGDLRVRQGIAFCTNKSELIASVYAFLSPEEAEGLQMDTFIPKGHWAYTAPSESYNFDAEKGAALFEEAGWTMTDSGYRANAAGDEMAISFKTTTAAFRQTWAAVFEANMKACGLRVLRFHVPASWWFGDTTGVARRDYELGAFAWVGTADPGGVSLYACDQIPAPENSWEGQNAMGWCNEAASTAIKLANNTLNRQERIDNYAITQEEFAKDMPSLPLFNRVDTNATAPDLAGFEPASGEPYVTYNAYEWEIPGRDTIVYAQSQEPASMFTLVEDAFVAAAAYSFIAGRPFKSLNYDFQPIYHKTLPTLENGGAVINEVEVKEGDVVVDANGDVGPLATGMMVKNAAGETVEFTGTPVMMQQMVVTSVFVDGLMWSDGTPVTAADAELNDKITCDPESGATGFFTCDRTASVEYPDDVTAIYTVVPGYLSPTYFVDFTQGARPSAQVLSDGRTLGDVPAKEWATLPEIAECPMGFGPYMLACGDWEKGVSLTMQANPYFVFGAPKTPNIVIVFILDTNQAIAQLRTGEADVLTGETTAGSEGVLKEAEAAGEVKVYIEASATWEHIDMGLFTK